MSAPQTRKIALLCNPLAGSGRAVEVARKLESVLLERNIRPDLLTNEWPASMEDYTDAWIIGGDGTLNYFVNHYTGHRANLSVFPGGTGNDFHWLLYGAMTMEEQVSHVLEASPRPIDLGVCNDRFFLNGMGIGFEGEVARALTGRKKRPGQASFLSTVIRKIFSYRSRTYDIYADTYQSSGKKLLIDICNGRRAGGGFHIAPVASPDDGYLNVVVANPLTSLQRLLYLPVIEKGKHLERPFVRHFLTKLIRVESNTPISYHLDGEYHTSPQIRVEIIPGALSFRY